MRFRHAMLMAFAIAAAPMAEAQEVVSGADFFFIGSRSSSNANIEDVVARLMSFDDNRDGRVEQAELIDRMQPLVARGDSNRDGALDDPEIRALAGAPVAATARRTFPPTGTYLPPQPVDAVEETALEALLRDMEAILRPEQLARFEQIARARRVPQVRASRGDRTLRMIVGGGPNLTSFIGQFGLGPLAHQEARAAIARYQVELDLKGVEQKTALVSQLSGALDPADLESFRMSLDRQNALPLNLSVNGGGEIVVPGTARTVIGRGVGGAIATPPPPLSKNVKTAAPVPAEP